jgi:deoxyhypusine synthase
MVEGRGKALHDDHCKIFVGCCANLVGTGVREYLTLLVQHKIIDCLVITGGGPEHDLRRVLAPECYTIDEYASCGLWSHDKGVRSYGNIRVSDQCEKYTATLRSMLLQILELQKDERQKRESGIPSEAYEDSCTWSWGPSKVWNFIGSMIDRFASAGSVEGSLLYWAWRNDIPIYCPSFTDGDIMRVAVTLPSPLKIDLVQDIQNLNKFAMRSKKTGMIILGGGVAKHHVCNANLMKNGANLSIFINNAQEFDGSDAGARPDEAVSWGKIHAEGNSVKVYSEVTMVFPILFVEAFLPLIIENQCR